MGTIIERMSRSLRLGLTVALLGGVATAVIAWQQSAREQRQGREDLDRRASLLLHRLSPGVAGALGAADPAGAVGDSLDGLSRLMGFALFDQRGRLVAKGKGLEMDARLEAAAVSALDLGEDWSGVVSGGAGPVHTSVRVLRGFNGEVLGGVVAYHDALYLESRATRSYIRGAGLTLAVGIGLLLLTSAAAWAQFERPLNLLADWMRRLRSGGESAPLPANLPVRKLADESERLAMSLRAARSEEWDRSQELLRAERAWSRERLRAHAVEALGGSQLVVVSNREPYMHQFRDGVAQLVMPASGLVTGLDPVLRACGGLWVAHGAGDADRQTSNASGCIAVPPGDPRYTLRRVWISKEEEQGYYYGFSNEGLWPLCHLTHERPVFRAGDWQQYVRANRRFADAVLEEVGPGPAVVMVQDYQLALVPAMLKRARPDLRVGLFWHIPWPNAEAFRICPFREELLEGILGADLVGFHLQQHCNNFLETVDRMIEARLDWDRFSVELRGHTAFVRPFPISVQPWSERGVASGDRLRERVLSLRQRHGLEGVRVCVSVDRLDYTKGIGERLKAVDRFFEKHPEQKGRVSFVQLGAPSRTHISRYRDLVGELESLADGVNWKHGADGRGEIRWKPVHFLVDHHDGQTVHAFMRAADLCVVSSLHDGMNLVAKEYVAAKGGEDGDDTDPGGAGVLLLSEFAGAARDLPEAIIINPYDTEGFADALHLGLAMDPQEARQRMARMRMRVESSNIYRWAAEFLTALAQTRPADQGGLVVVGGNARQPAP